MGVNTQSGPGGLSHPTMEVSAHGNRRPCMRRLMHAPKNIWVMDERLPRPSRALAVAVDIASAGDARLTIAHPLAEDEDAASEERPDMVVAGTAQGGRLRRLLRRDLGLTLLKHAPTAVVLVRDPPGPGRR